MSNEEMAVLLANHEQRIVGVEHRVKDVEVSQKQITELTISVRELAISLKNMTEEQKEQSERIKKLESEPGKKWKLVGTKMIEVAVSIIGGALIAGLVLLVGLNL